MRLGNRRATDPDFLTRALQDATPFEVSEGERRILNLKVAEVKSPSAGRTVTVRPVGPDERLYSVVLPEKAHAQMLPGARVAGRHSVTR